MTLCSLLIFTTEGWLAPQTDLIAGISVGAMVVPQGMSYAKLAGLPNVYGLYGAFVPVMIYAALGSSPQLVSLASSRALCLCFACVGMQSNAVLLWSFCLSVFCHFSQREAVILFVHAQMLQSEGIIALLAKQLLL